MHDFAFVFPLMGLGCFKRKLKNVKPGVLSLPRPWPELVTRGLRSSPTNVGAAIGLEEIFGKKAMAVGAEKQRAKIGQGFVKG